MDKNKVFVVNSSEISGRLDPFFYIPSVVDLEKRISTVATHRLRDFVIRMSGGATPSTKEAETHYTEEDEGIPFVRVQNLSTTGKLKLDDVRRITRSTHEGLLQRSQLEGGELLVKITGVGRMAIASVVPENFECNINQHLVAIKTKDKKTSETLAAYLNLDIAERLASRRSTGGTRPALDYPALLSLPVIFDERIPKLINSAVERYNAKQDQARAQLAGIDTLLLRELGINPIAAPPNTVEGRVFYRHFSEVTGERFDPLYFQEDLFACVRGANCPLVLLGDNVRRIITGFAAGRDEQSDEDGIIQIRPTNISDDRELIFNRNIHIDVTEAQSRVADLLVKGEVLFNNTNSQELVGKTVYFDLDDPFFCSNHITRISTNKRLDPQYLAYILNLYQRQKVFFRLCTNWNNQSGVGRDVLHKLLIPIPESTSRQKEIVQHLESKRTEAKRLFVEAEAELKNAKTEIEAMILGDE